MVIWLLEKIAEILTIDHKLPTDEVFLTVFLHLTARLALVALDGQAAPSEEEKATEN